MNGTLQVYIRVGVLLSIIRVPLLVNKGVCLTHPAGNVQNASAPRLPPSAPALNL